MALNRYKDAVQEYENTAKLFFEELGIRPSEHDAAVRADEQPP